MQVAAAIATGLAGAGVASELAALVYGLAFVPLTAEHSTWSSPPGKPYDLDEQAQDALRAVWAEFIVRDPGPRQHIGRPARPSSDAHL